MKQVEINICQIVLDLDSKYLEAVIATPMYDWSSKFFFKIIRTTINDETILRIYRKSLEDLEKNKSEIESFNYISLYVSQSDTKKPRNKRTFEFYEKICDALDTWLQNNIKIILKI